MNTKPHHRNVNRRGDFACDVEVTCHNIASRFSMHSETAHIFRKYETVARIFQSVHNQNKYFLVLIQVARIDHEVKLPPQDVLTNISYNCS